MSKPRFLILSILLLLMTTACGQCGDLPGLGKALPTPDRNITISQEAANRFAEKWQKALDDLKTGGGARLDFTDTELTSYVNLKTSELGSLPIQNSTIWFTQGEVVVAGTIKGRKLPINGNGVLILEPSLIDGKLYVNPKRASVGSIELPRSWLKSAFDQINTQLANLQKNITIEKFDVREGEMLILAASSQ